jgi:hypothetical protein
MGQLGGSLSTLLGSGADVDGYRENGKFHPRTCFTKGTLVHTINGLKAIEEVKIGDVVLSWDEKTKTNSYKKVLNTFVRNTDQIYNLTIGEEKLETTWNHPFYVKDKGWVQAKDLKRGETMISPKGSMLTLKDITIEERDETVYNFEVEDNHTYYVGKDGVLVHNTECKINRADPTDAKVKLNGKEYKIEYDEKTKQYTVKDDFGNKLVYTFNKDKDGNPIIDGKAIADNFTTGGCASRGIKNTCLSKPLFYDNIRPNKVIINGSLLEDGGGMYVSSKGRLRVDNKIAAGTIISTNGQDNDVNDAIAMAQSNRNVCNGKKNCSVYHTFNATTGGTGIQDTMDSRTFTNITERFRTAEPAERNTIREEAFRLRPALRTLTNALVAGNIPILIGHSQGALLQSLAIEFANSDSDERSELSPTRNTVWITAGGAQTPANLPENDQRRIKRGIFIQNKDDKVITAVRMTGGTIVPPNPNLNNLKIDTINVTGCDGKMGHAYGSCYAERVQAIIKEQE